jgi:hypothetical protein
MNVADYVRQMAGRKRSECFLQYVSEFNRPVSIIDLGGTFEMWQRWGISCQHSLQITLVNHHERDKSHTREVAGADFIKEEILDMRDLSSDYLRQFDLVFSNSALEHLGSRREQEEVSKRIIDCGRPYFIGVPDRFSPIDPHFANPLVPFFAAYPRKVQAALLIVNRFGSGSRSRTFLEAQDRLKFYNPISRSRLRALFPNAEVVRQSILGVSVFLVAQRV